VALRTANAEAHIALDPGAYREPPRAAVVRHFSAAVADGHGGVLVAHTRDGGVVEVLRHPDPPEHQILRPGPSAQIHTVVLAEARGLGVGTVLLDAAEAWAAGRGITYLSAGRCP
jgi:GNAT superfamily N-acetyltransferase